MIYLQLTIEVKGANCIPRPVARATAHFYGQTQASEVKKKVSKGQKNTQISRNQKPANIIHCIGKPSPVT